MSTIENRLGSKHGARYRPVHWSDLYAEGGVKIIGWGIEEKQSGKRRYVPVGWDGKIHPFKSKREAQDLCDRLNWEAAH